MCKRRRTVICCLSLQTYGSRYGAVLFVMDNKNSILLDENTHRLLMCCRMAKSMSVGEVFLDATTHRIVWCIAREGKPNLRFSSLDEMERHLEHLLMVRAEKNTERACQYGQAGKKKGRHYQRATKGPNKRGAYVVLQ